MAARRARSEISLKRVYESPEGTDGFRVLVDRLWPRGLKKSEGAIDEHLKEVAPSAALREWFGHDALKWERFRRRYELELDGKPAPIAHLADKAKRGKLTLLYAAKDSARNNAVVLRDYLLRRHRRQG
jgi:uncharacterized protein YeaO (DUF488 family)